MGGATITRMHITTTYLYMKLTQLTKLTLILQLPHLTNPEPSTPSDRPCISSQGLTLTMTRACVLAIEFLPPYLPYINDTLLLV